MYNEPVNEELRRMIGPNFFNVVGARKITWHQHGCVFNIPRAKIEIRKMGFWHIYYFKGNDSKVTMVLNPKLFEERFTAVTGLKTRCEEI